MKRLWPGYALLAASTVQASRYEPLAGRMPVFAGQSPQASLDYWALPNTSPPAGFSDYTSYDVGAPHKDYAPDAPRICRLNDNPAPEKYWAEKISRPPFLNLAPHLCDKLRMEGE